jgi:hypothetical protein
MVLCSLTEVDRCLRGVYCLYHQGDDYADDAGSMHLWIVSLLLRDYKAPYPRTWNLTVTNQLSLPVLIALVHRLLRHEYTSKGLLLLWVVMMPEWVAHLERWETCMKGKTRSEAGIGKRREWGWISLYVLRSRFEGFWQWCNTLC